MMPYTPTEWSRGDVVTSEKLNKLEQGVAEAGGGSGGVLVVHDNDGTLDATWQQIKDAGFAVLNIESTIGLSTEISSNESEEEYGIRFTTFTSVGFDDPISYMANSPTGELVMTD